jgi:hypothetical protein
VSEYSVFQEIFRQLTNELRAGTSLRSIIQQVISLSLYLSMSLSYFTFLSMFSRTCFHELQNPALQRNLQGRYKEINSVVQVIDLLLEISRVWSCEFVFVYLPCLPPPLFFFLPSPSLCLTRAGWVDH